MSSFEDNYFQFKFLLIELSKSGLKLQKETSNRDKDYYISQDIIQIAKESMALTKKEIKIEIANL
ncbi:hypothetical protein BPAE_0067g00010 [Botrytis paeoniae]|uniref:Uncharacterized protein n=1 Tax=Botrytis paeoniae TaxID=278948 RepID=A0A4Z1FST4_9HELO|nr:hypothetical protein BPAE_0067g00010 [Botrytis paeoniae]